MSGIKVDVLAYEATETTGNQNWVGLLGLDFDVPAAGVVITALGVYDSDEDGIQGTIEVAILNQSNGLTVVGPITISGSGNPLEGGHRVGVIAPVSLGVGSYSVVAVGFGSNDLNGNSGFAGYSAINTNDGGGLINFTGFRYGASTTMSLPSSIGSDAGRFHAGTFIYRAR